MKIKIALILFEDGSWTAFGASGQCDKEMMENASGNSDCGEALMRRWIEVDLETPDLRTIRGIPIDS